MGALSAVAATIVLHGDLPAPLGRAGGALGHPLVRLRLRPAGCSPTGSRSCSAWRSARPPSLALQRDRRLLAPAARGAERDLEPGGRPVPGDGRRRLRAGGARRGRADQARGRRSRSRPRAWCRRCCSASRSPRAATRRSRSPPTCRSRCSPSLCLIVLPRSERTLRIAAVLYALGATLALVVPTAMGGNAVRLGALLGGPVMACALAGAGRAAAAGRAGGAGARRAGCLAGVAGRARHLQGRDRPRGRGLLLRPGARVLPAAARPAPRGDPVHARPLGGRGGGLRGAARARLAAPARHRAAPDLLQGRPEPAHLRQLAVGERRALRGAARRQARSQRLPRARADREPACPTSSCARASTTGASTRSRCPRRS